MPPDVFVGARHTVIERLATAIRSEADTAIAARGRFAVAIPGGSVAAALAGVALDWSRSDLFWVDERAVPPSSPDSNFGLARSVWLDPAGASPMALHRMPADDPDLDRAARAYGEELRRVLGEWPRFDLVLLGMGSDGHVASLFPGHPALSEQQRLVVPVLDAHRLPPRRLTLTMPLLTGARRAIVMAMGASKADAMKAAVRGDDPSLPVAIVLRSSSSVLVLLDEDAGRLL